MSSSLVDAPAALPPSLDHSETSEHPLVRQSQWQRRMHARNWGSRSRIVDALWRDDDPAMQRRACRMGGCACMPSVGVMSDGKPVACLNRCRDRMCPLCAGIRGRRTTAAIATAVGHWSTCRFVTLTLKSNDEPLADQVKRLYASFKLLRRTKWWKGLVHGGVAVLEVTWHSGTRRWHPHLHCLVDGDFMPQAQLSAAWLKVTGDSMIVDVRAVHDRVNAVNYVARYLGKPCGVDDWPPEVIRAYAVALRGVRMFNAFGTKRQLDDSELTRDEAPVYVETVISLSELDTFRAGGVVQAEHACEILSRVGWPWTALLREGPAPPLPMNVPVEPEELTRVVALIREVVLTAHPERATAKPAKKHVDRQGVLFHRWAV